MHYWPSQLVQLNLSGGRSSWEPVLSHRPHYLGQVQARELAVTQKSPTPATPGYLGKVTETTRFCLCIPGEPEGMSRGGNPLQASVPVTPGKSPAERWPEDNMAGPKTGALGTLRVPRELVPEAMPSASHNS